MKNVWILLMLIACNVSAQTGTGAIRGTITDKETGEPVFACKVKLYEAGTQALLSGAYSDFDGKFLLANIAPGAYKLVVENEIEGYASYTQELAVQAERTFTMDIQLTRQAELYDIQEVMVTTSKRKDAMMMREKGTSSAADVVRSTPGVTTGGKLRKRGRKAEGMTTSAYQAGNDGNQYNAVKDNDFQKVKKEPLSTFSIDVDKGSYTNIRRHIRNDQLPPTDAVRIEECINYFDYDYPQPTDETPFSVTTEYTDCPWNSAHKLVHIGIKGVELDKEQSPANNLVFLVDISGSMQGSDRIELVKSGLMMLVDQLRPEDRVAIVTYAGDSRIALKSTKGSDKETIKAAIGNLSASGSTNGSSAIEMAYEIAEKNFKEKGNNRVILATDGDFNVGITDQDELVKLIEQKREKDIFLSVLGVGQGNLHDGQMEQIADHGNGNYFFLDNVLEAKRVMVNDLTGLLYTIAKDVKLQIEFNPDHVQSYRLIGYANRMLEAEDFNDDKKDAGELGSGHSVTAFYEIVPVGTPEDTEESVDPLKYQQLKSVTSQNFNEELFTLKLRYKKPDENKSKLITHICTNTLTPFQESSENCRFASAVAEFGLLLRNSEYKGTASFSSAIERARSSKGADTNELRAEFIQLMESAEIMMDQALQTEDH